MNHLPTTQDLNREELSMLLEAVIFHLPGGEASV